MPRILVIQPDDAAREAILDLLAQTPDLEAVPCTVLDQALDQMHAGQFDMAIADLQVASADDGSFLAALIKANARRPVLLTGTDGKVE